MKETNWYKNKSCSLPETKTNQMLKRHWLPSYFFTGECTHSKALQFQIHSLQYHRSLPYTLAFVSVPHCYPRLILTHAFPTRLGVSCWACGTPQIMLCYHDTIYRKEGNWMTVWSFAYELGSPIQKLITLI